MLPAKGESFKSWGFRRAFNFWPCYWGTGGRVAYIAHDWMEVRVELPLNVRTRNYVGTIFGGSMYGSIDPVYMLMLLKTLGPEYIVWDKAADIRFLKPGRKLLTAVLRLSAEELQAIRDVCADGKSVDRIYPVEFVDGDGTICARVMKTLYVRKKRAE